MIISFYRTVSKVDDKVKGSPVSAEIVITDGNNQEKIGTLKFSNQTMWAKFFGAVQMGALRIKELTVVMENAVEDKALVEKVTLPTAKTTVVTGIGSK